MAGARLINGSEKTGARCGSSPVKGAKLCWVKAHETNGAECP